MFTDKVLYDLHWLPDGRGLVVAYGARPAVFRRQIGYVAWPGGAFRTITRDTNSYTTVTLSADGKIAATVQVKTTHTIDIIPGGRTKGSSPTPVLSGIPGAFALSWAGGRELLLSNGTDLIEANVDGSNRKTLASDAAGSINSAARCGKQYVVVSWRRQWSENMAAKCGRLRLHAAHGRERGLQSDLFSGCEMGVLPGPGGRPYPASSH